MVLAAFCWGISAIFAKGAFERGIEPVRMAEARIVVAAIPLLAYLLLRRRHLLVPPRDSRAAILVFGLGLVAVNGAYYTAIDRLPVGIAIAIQYTGPVMVLLISAVLLQRAPTRRVWAAALLTLAGAVLVSGAYAGLRDLDGVGVAAAAVSAVTFAIYLLSAEAAGKRGSHAATTLAIGFLVATVAWGAWLPWWSWPFERLADPEIALRVLGVGLVGTLLPFLLMVTALRIISAGVAGIASTSEPVFASALAWLLLGQVLDLPQLIGGGLVVAGVVLAQITRRGAAGESVAVEVAA